MAYVRWALNFVRLQPNGHSSAEFAIRLRIIREFVIPTAEKMHITFCRTATMRVASSRVLPNSCVPSVARNSTEQRVSHFPY